MSIYRFKPAFQKILRPWAVRLDAWGVRANHVTVMACLVSVACGLMLTLGTWPALAYGVIPLWMLVRMALNALDGMLAREHGHASDMGFFLNELSDVVSDAALCLPFVHLWPEDALWLLVIVVLAALSEMAGVLGLAIGAHRRYDGPMGKSDRAFVWGVVSAVVASGLEWPQWARLLWPLLALSIAWTVVRRVQNALKEKNGI